MAPTTEVLRNSLLYVSLFEINFLTLQRNRFAFIMRLKGNGVRIPDSPAAVICPCWQQTTMSLIL